MPTLNIEQLNMLAEAAWHAGIDEEESAFYGDYSGRGMMGRNCAAIDIDGTGELVKLFVQIAVIDPGLAAALAADLHTDSMGHGIVAYFPAFTVDQES